MIRMLRWWDRLPEAGRWRWRCGVQGLGHCVASKIYVAEQRRTPTIQRSVSQTVPTPSRNRPATPTCPLSHNFTLAPSPAPRAPRQSHSLPNPLVSEAPNPAFRIPCPKSPCAPHVPPPLSTPGQRPSSQAKRRRGFRGLKAGRGSLAFCEG